MHIQMDRLYQAAKELAGVEGQTDVAMALGQSPQTAHNWEKRGVSKLGALKAQTVWGVSATWILTGEGSMVLAPAAATVATPPANHHPFNLGPMRVRGAEAPVTIPIRFVQIRLRAGATGFVTELQPDDGGIYELPVDVLQALDIEPQWLMAMRVKGSSMKPMMDEDEIVVVSRKHVEPVDEEVYAFNYNGEPLIKQLLKKGMDWCLHSFNPRFKDLSARGAQCDIVGMVVYQPPRILGAKARMR